MNGVVCFSVDQHAVPALVGELYPHQVRKKPGFCVKLSIERKGSLETLDGFFYAMRSSEDGDGRRHAEGVTPLPRPAASPKSSLEGGDPFESVIRFQTRFTVECLNLEGLKSRRPVVTNLAPTPRRNGPQHLVPQFLADDWGVGDVGVQSEMGQ